MRDWVTIKQQRQMKIDVEEKKQANELLRVTS